MFIDLVSYPLPVCPYGFYGEECSQDCVCSITGRCSPHDGTCDCSPGWTGTRCDIGEMLCFNILVLYTKAICSFSFMCKQTLL